MATPHEQGQEVGPHPGEASEGPGQEPDEAPRQVTRVQGSDGQLPTRRNGLPAPEKEARDVGGRRRRRRRAKTQLSARRTPW